ncbi:MAG: tripartite tricarboxylate transporter substrate binding protein [Betaproteobacteria bacterium]|nr:MAG: tripartite tricarboxylate transporter substrate binding protein [Betaproteobacteria bacterium]
MYARHLTAAFVAATTFAGTPAQAQTTAWPSKPIRWIVPFPPGGPADVVTRMLSAKLAERVGQPGIVENRGGAGGNVGHEAAARAAPDGTTVVFVVPAIITNPFFLKASIDPFRELAPVIHLDSASMVLLTHPAFPANTVAELISRARAKPGSVSCASSGALPQVGCEMLRIHAGAEMIMVQYKGNAPALNALMGGEVNLLFDVVNVAQVQVKSGRVRAIASTNPKRGIGPFGELPVLAETIPDFELVTWHGVMVPAATPRDIVLRLNREIQSVLGDPDIRRRFADGGLDIRGGTPEEFGAILKRDYTKYGKTLTGAGINPE